MAKPKPARPAGSPLGTVGPKLPAHLSLTEHGEGGGELNVNLAALPCPDRTMTANWIDVVGSGGDVEIVFGQAYPGGGELAAALIVCLAKPDAARLLGGPGAQAAPGSFPEKVRAYCHRVGLEARQLAPLKAPSRFVFERAKIGLFSFVDTEAELRFYRLSANDFQALRRGDSAELVYPVVQVVLSVDLLLTFLEKLAVATAEAGDE